MGMDIIVDHAMLRNVDGVRLQPFFIRASRFIVTTGNGTGTKNVLIWNCALRFVFSIQSSVYGATTVVL